ncbi:MAG: right-handed parallel beta-helix repeat-containing protein [Verrucomicrobiota bacterium]|nr:right-handed parallel beta-helix repeat-containing protein [Verrucomicrobiota bacterium]
MKSSMPILCLAPAMFFAAPLPAQQTSQYQSHPPLRPLPEASSRPASAGPGRYVDAVKGSDANDGTREQPWQTLSHAVRQLSAGDTLYLRGGTYYEHVKLTQSGQPGQPITIRSYPGELVVLDGGFREFFENPAGAWEPVSDGAKDEYRSRKSYPGLGAGGGNFGDSLVPLIRYKLCDMRSANEYWRPGLGNQQESAIGIYFGPGLLWNQATGRIHIRLSHTRLEGLGKRHYRGETDPRKIPIVVNQDQNALRLENARHVRLQDLVLRGSSVPLSIAGSEDIELDGLTIYAGSYGLQIGRTTKLRVVNTAFRGRAAPWHSRGHHKNRTSVGYLAIAEGDCHDFEFSFCEFTDHHDGVKLFRCDSVRFHHNVVDHLNDDGIEFSPLQAAGAWGTYHVYQNRISRCQTTFSLHGGVPVDFDKPNGVYIYRNVIDLRQGLYKGVPDPDATAAGGPKAKMDRFDYPSRLLHEHGSPIYPPMFFYHNTILARENSTEAQRGQYAQGAGSNGIARSRRRVFNNIVVQPRGKHGYFFKTPNKDPLFKIPAGVDLAGRWESLLEHRRRKGPSVHWPAFPLA